MCIKLEINRGYTTVHGQPTIKIRYSCQILIKIGFSRQIFEKYSNIKFHKNPSSGRRFLLCGRTDRARLVVAFRNFAIAPKKCSSDTRVKDRKTANSPHCYVIHNFLPHLLFLWIKTTPFTRFNVELQCL